MPGRYDQSDSYDDWDVDDPDGPQECDLAGEDDEDTPTVPCPHCRRPVPDFADRCPYCGDWIVQTSGPPTRRGVWFVVIAVLLALMLLGWFVI